MTGKSSLARSAGDVPRRGGGGCLRSKRMAPPGRRRIWGKVVVRVWGKLRDELELIQPLAAKIWGKQRHRIGGVKSCRILAPMKRRSFPLWLLRDLPALIGIAWSFWPLVIMVIANGAKAMRGRQVSPAVYEHLMLMLPIAEARLRFALHRQAYRALGWNPRTIALEALHPVATWSDFATRFEAYRASMMDLHASAAFFLNEHRRLYRIRSRVDANAVHAAHGSTGALRAAHHEAVCVATSNEPRCRVALMVSSDRRERPSKDEGGRTYARASENATMRLFRPPPAQHALALRAGKGLCVIQFGGSAL
jgi:hypothetical protein